MVMVAAARYPTPETGMGAPALEGGWLDALLVWWSRDRVGGRFQDYVGLRRTTWDYLTGVCGGRYAACTGVRAWELGCLLGLLARFVSPPFVQRGALLSAAPVSPVWCWWERGGVLFLHTLPTLSPQSA